MRQANAAILLLASLPVKCKRCETLALIRAEIHSLTEEEVLLGSLRLCRGGCSDLSIGNPSCRSFGGMVGGPSYKYSFSRMQPRYRSA